jgi:hypothetical protein
MIASSRVSNVNVDIYSKNDLKSSSISKEVEEMYVRAA